MTIVIFILGFLFGSILQYARLNRFNTISGMALLNNFAVAKAIAVTIGVGAILLSIEIGLGLASFHAKPLIIGGIMLGGLIFGAGMAILGYCPGTLPVSMGEGSLDAFIGMAGGLAGGLVYTLILPAIQSLLGPDAGTITLQSLTGENSVVYFVITFLLAALFIGIAFWLNKKEQAKDLKWLYAGIALAILNGIVFLSTVTDRQIGASTFYPYLSDVLAGVTENEYFTKIEKSGNWEMIFLGGAFFSGLLLSLIRKDFKLTLIHENWKKYKDNSATSRIVWSFVGGFILIVGARMAGGCTSGHVISGGMQLAASSLIFAAFVFAGLLVTGKVFYRKSS